MTVFRRVLVVSLAAAVAASLLDFTATAAPGTPFRVSAIAGSAAILAADSGDTYALLGLTLGMSPDEVLAVAKSAGWKTSVRQAALPSNVAYVAEIGIAAPFPTTVEFSAATGKSTRITARSTTVEILAEHDALYQAAIAKWGVPLKPRTGGMPTYFDWADRNGIHPTYGKADFEQQYPGSVTIADEAARRASQAFLAQPAKPKPTL